MALRELILDADDPSITGGLVESLKWGEPAWRPKRARVGSTIRVAPYGSDGGDIAMLVHCQTRLADQFRETYRDQLRIDGDRAVVFSVSEPLPKAVIQHCAAMAFTYHLRKG